MENDKDFRNKKILDLHNSGATIKEIIDSTGMSKSGIYKVIGSIIQVGDIPSKDIVEVKLEGTEERFESFVGWERTNVNEYANKSTGEVARVVYVKAKSEDKFGYFVKLGNQEKKFNPADNVIK